MKVTSDKIEIKVTYQFMALSAHDSCSENMHCNFHLLVIVTVLMYL